MVTQISMDNPEVVEAIPDPLSVSQFLCNPRRLLKVGDCLQIVSQISINKPELGEAIPDSLPLSDFPCNAQRLLIVEDRLRIVA